MDEKTKEAAIDKTEAMAAIATLCGHHMVSPAMIDHYVEKIKKGKISPEAAVKKLAGPCVCGIFNTDRTVEVLKRMAARSC